jgi:hypothetical protein
MDTFSEAASEGKGGLHKIGQFVAEDEQSAILLNVGTDVIH